MRFSVICVCRMAGEKLLDTVGSVMKQDMPDFEMLIKSDGTDEEILPRLPGDSRVRVISEPDNGIYDAMNRALSEAVGDYVVFLGAGDRLYDEKVLSEVSEAASREEDTPGIIYGDVIEETTGQKVCPPPVITPFVCFRNVPCHQSCFYKRELLMKHPFVPKYRVRADYEQFLNLVLREKAKTLYIPRLVARYEGGGFSESPEGLKMSRQEHRDITVMYFPGGRLLLYRAYLLLTLAPLRRKLEQSPATTAAYNDIRNKLRGRHRE